MTFWTRSKSNLMKSENRPCSFYGGLFPYSYVYLCIFNAQWSIFYLKCQFMEKVHFASFWGTNWALYALILHYFTISGLIWTPTNSISIYYHSKRLWMVSMYIEMYKTPYFLRICSFLAILAHENAVETLNFDFFQKKIFDLIY